ncbi:hypothetical protein MNV49_002923 [Pseudohyphozyma bogoriensis]|nr:hypothetical protein MNV49_002923 [Pseudohyphozyma bogoriensis]
MCLTQASTSAPSPLSDLPFSESTTSPNSGSSPFSQLADAVASGHRRTTISLLSVLPESDWPNLPRPLFDDLFDFLSPTSHPEVWTNKPTVAWKWLRRLMKIAESNGWELQDGQMVAAFDAGVRAEEVRRSRTKEKDWLRPSREELARRAYLDSMWFTYLDLEQPDKPEQDAQMIERYALAVLFRQREGPFMDAYRLAMSRTHRPTRPTPSPLASTFLAILLRDRPKFALAHIHVMLEANRIPTRQETLRLVNSDSQEDLYEAAREALDVSAANMDEIYERRLHRISRDEWADKYPSLALIRWLAFERRPLGQANEPSRREWLYGALRLWEVIYGNDGRGREAGRLLATLVKEACALEVESPQPPTSSQLPPPPSSISLAVKLALEFLDTPVLVHLSHQLLRAVCVASPSAPLARELYLGIRDRAPPTSRWPHRWGPEQVTEYLFLLRDKDPAFTLRLYFDWTGDGLQVTPAAGLRSVWKAIGTRGSVEEAARLMGDYEEAGRVNYVRMVSTILRASCEAMHPIKTVRLLDYFINLGSTPISLPVFNAILQTLALTTQDRRKDVTRYLQHLIRNGPTPETETWNALLASHAFRPQLGLADIDALGHSYNAMLKYNLKPDRTTFSILVHGFLRAMERCPPTKMLAAAQRAFIAASARRILVKGQQAANLMVKLAERGQFEEAKEVGEKWWRDADRVAREDGQQWKIVEMGVEGKEVLEARTVVLRLESFAKGVKWMGKEGDRKVERREQPDSFPLDREGEVEKVNKFDQSFRC